MSIIHNWLARSVLGSAVVLASTCLGQQAPASSDFAKHLQSAQTDLDSQKYRDAVTELRAAIAIQSETRGAYYQLGFALFQLRDSKAAEKAFLKELEFKPPDPYSLYYLGRIAADAGQPKQSIEFFQQSLAAGEVLDCRERLGSTYLTTGRLEEAIRFLQESVRVRPENGSLHYLLGRAYKQKGRNSEAKLEFDAAARWKGKVREDMTALSELRSALLRKNRTEGLSRAQEISTSNDPDILMASATALGQAGMHEEAIGFLNRTIALSPNIPEAHYDLARAYIATDNRPGARPELEKAVALKPDFYEAQVVLGTLLVDEGNGDAALPHLREAAKLRSDSPKLLMMLGLQYYQRGYYADAIDVLKNAAALAPDSPDPYYLLIEAYYRNIEYERALNLAKETETRFPDLPMSHFHLGAQLNNMGHLPEAKQQLDLALAKDPELVEARAMLGDVLFKMGNAEESLAPFRAAVAADPKLMEAQAGLGKALIQLKRYPEAAAAMEAAVKIDPALASLHLYLSQAYRALSRPEEAKKEAAVFSRLNQERAAARDREGDRRYPN